MVRSPPMPPEELDAEERVVLTADKARQGVELGVMRYVLGVSLVAVVIGLGIMVYIFYV